MRIPFQLPEVRLLDLSLGCTDLHDARLVMIRLVRGFQRSKSYVLTRDLSCAIERTQRRSRQPQLVIYTREFYKPWVVVTGDSELCNACCTSLKHQGACKVPMCWRFTFSQLQVAGCMHMTAIVTASLKSLIAAIAAFQCRGCGCLSNKRDTTVPSELPWAPQLVPDCFRAK